MARVESTERQIEAWEKELARLRSEDRVAVPSYARAALAQRIRATEQNIAGAKRWVAIAQAVDEAGPFTVAESHVGGVTIHFQRTKLIVTEGGIEQRGAH